MLLIFSSDKFQLNQVVYRNFPILLDSNMRIVEVVHRFFLYQCITRGRLNSKRSWEAMGQNIYDYFSFLEAHHLTWDAFKYNQDHSIVAAYRDWSVKVCGLKSNTVNQRLRSIVIFYNHAYRKSWIDTLPFDLEEVRIRKTKGFLGHVNVGDSHVITPNIMLKEFKEPIKLLSKMQVKILLETVINSTHKLMIRLALQTGLRKEEIATFPKKYIVNPDSREDIKNIIIVTLNPLDMKIKGSKPRKIHIPRLLMQDLWQYILHERHQLEAIGRESQTILFLNRYGKPLASNGKSFGKILKDLNLSFHVAPHMLRHTYATHTLFEMRERKSKNDPLMYVRDRLGHASVTTTEQYLHYLDEVEDDVMTKYQEEIDGLSLGGYTN